MVIRELEALADGEKSSMNDIDWSMIFDGWAPIVRTLVLGTSSYFLLILLLRVSGKRTLSKMNAFYLVVTVAFGSTLASILTSLQFGLIIITTATFCDCQFHTTFFTAECITLNGFNHLNGHFNLLQKRVSGFAAL